jgi:hypothetical protein
MENYSKRIWQKLKLSLTKIPTVFQIEKSQKPPKPSATNPLTTSTLPTVGR